LWHVTPPRPREIEYLLNEAIQQHWSESQLRFALPVEFAHSGDGLGNVFQRMLN